ncbi:MAG: hypothetical protein RL317_280 [Pseudomonadota bacterium]|jgi:hypothetical protein
MHSGDMSLSVRHGYPLAVLDRCVGWAMELCCSETDLDGWTGTAARSRVALTVQFIAPGFEEAPSFE